MALNLSGVTSSALSLSNLLMVSPQNVIGYQPQNNPSEGKDAPKKKALLFHIEGENAARLASGITDHYVEDNTAIANQISLAPEEITVNGFIGELNDVIPQEFRPLKIAAEKLTSIAAFEPSLSETAIIAYNTAFQAYQLAMSIANTAVSTWETISGDSSNINQAVIGGEGETALQILQGGTLKNQNKQQIAFQQFYGYYRARTLFTVQTPWAVFQNMAIKNLNAIQDSETRMITDFEITFKAIRFAQTKYSRDAVSAQYQGRSSAQASDLVNHGTSTPPTSGQSFSDLISRTA